MARPLLNRSEALAWLPARADLGGAAAGLPIDDRFLFWPAGSRTPQVSSLAALGKIKSIVLVIDARDVLLLEANVPPLPASKLALALPNIVEDQMIQDPTQCVIALGEKTSQGHRQLAIADRAWLEAVKGSFERRGVKVSAIWPAQLALPYRKGRWCLAATQQGLTLRTDVCQLGWPGGHSHEQRVEALEGLFNTVSLRDKADPAQVGVDACIDEPQWREVLERFAAQRNLSIEIFALPRPTHPGIDLAAAASGKLGKTTANQKTDWRLWRWPIGMGAACVLSALVGLNLYWWKLSREQAQLERTSEQLFRAAFPKVPTVQDPLRQAKGLVNELRRTSGQAAADDFNVLIAKLGEGLNSASLNSLAMLEFRDGKLKVKFQPGFADNPPAREQLKSNLLRAGLTIQFDNEREPLATIGVAT